MAKAMGRKYVRIEVWAACATRRRSAVTDYRRRDAGTHRGRAQAGRGCQSADAAG
ncbi:MAG: hypothetical protein ACLR8P_11620 [Clostridium fessum]